MALYTFRVDGRCPGGAHVAITIKKDGVDWKQKVLLYDNILNLDVSIEDAMIFFIRQAIKTSNASTLLQMKNAIEAIEVTL